ncbi:RlpA-like double-psi beta-barrel domain containing protein [Parasponia andersonii]|uniref:RlpA-like double-psi beta-barrel domain containing protein n=1 Tax=Parasponia andersonii TaxID=3476 RepID=A0A2P5DSJ9_PARAD|nr:RlpA-like double-psi beta-barrel domain containing protein [Parasponia andersonii]
MATPQFHQFIFVAAATLLSNLSFHSLVHAQETGIATFYTPPYQASSCYGFEDQGVMIAAASDAIYNNGAACGQIYHWSKSLTTVHLDRVGVLLTYHKEAFASIADPASGAINDLKVTDQN